MPALTSVEGYLRIIDNDFLTSLDGLSTLLVNDSGFRTPGLV